MRELLIATLLLPASALALDAIVGEWALDAESCRESRMTFTHDGAHEALIAEDGRWQSLAAGEYRREGDVLIISMGETEQQLQVLVAEGDRLVLRNPDSGIGDLTTELVRCPTR